MVSVVYMFLAGILFIIWMVMYALLLPLRKAARWLNNKLLADSYDAICPGPSMSVLEAVLELPLCLCSYAYYGMMQRLLLPKVAKTRLQSIKTCWTDTLYNGLGQGKKDPKLVLAALLFGPRWNTHTNNQNLGVDPGERRMCTLAVENINMRGFAWQIVVYGNRMGRQIIATCHQQPDGGDTVQLEVVTKEPYSTTFNLMMRCYLFDGVEQATLPRVWLDGKLLTQEPSTFAKHHLNFNFDLRSQQRLHHLALHFYVFPVLCFRRWFSKRFVRSQFLPVGNPSTQWLYGPVFQGFALHFEVPPSVLKDHLVFCTVYSRASMPTLPCYEITEPDQTLEVCEEDGYWATRCVRKDGRPTCAEVLQQISVTLMRKVWTT